MLTFQIVPYAEIESLSSLGRIRKLLTIAKENKIVLLQGRLSKEEEAELIKVTMEEINKDFKGIELAVLEPNVGDLGGIAKIRNTFADAILGNRAGWTVIGPANLVKQIKKDPNKIQLYTQENGHKKKKKKR